MTDTVTPLVCSECGEGNYVQAYGVLFRCEECAHEVNSETDVYPHIDDDEMLTVLPGGILATES